MVDSSLKGYRFGPKSVKYFAMQSFYHNPCSSARWRLFSHSGLATGRRSDENSDTCHDGFHVDANRSDGSTTSCSSSGRHTRNEPRVECGAKEPGAPIEEHRSGR